MTLVNTGPPVRILWIMRKLLPLLVLVAAPALAHPSVSIVADSRGNLYYSDLKQVWRLGTDGKKTIVVPNVHTHELAIDAQDNLYGEHLWYEGERIDKWGHYVWRRTPGASCRWSSRARKGSSRTTASYETAPGRCTGAIATRA
jgi:hypothetical protein